MPYIIQESETPGFWICTDPKNKIVCKFKHKDFNKTQHFTVLDDKPRGAIELATAARLMGDWLRKYHYSKLF